MMSLGAVFASSRIAGGGASVVLLAATFCAAAVLCAAFAVCACGTCWLFSATFIDGAVATGAAGITAGACGAVICFVGACAISSFFPLKLNQRDTASPASAKPMPTRFAQRYLILRAGETPCSGAALGDGIAVRTVLRSFV